MHQIDHKNPDHCTLGRALAEQAAHNGDTVYLAFGERRYRYAQVNAQVNRIANALAGQGIGLGDMIALYMDSCPEYVWAALAASKLGAIWVPVNSDYKGEWLADTVRRSRPAAMVVDAAHAARLAAAGGPPAGCALYWVGDGPLAGIENARAFAELLDGDDAEPDQSAIRCADTCAVLWTSGTTGRSKGVMQSHNVWINAATLANVLFMPRSGDVAFNVMPLYNSAAWVTGVFRALVAGVTVAVDPSFSVGDFWRRADFYGATQAFTLGAMHVFLLNAPERPDDAAHAMRVMHCVPLETERADAFSRRFGVRVIGQGYSQSEAMGSIAQGHGSRERWPPNSCGNAIESAVHAKLVDEAGNEAPVNTPGELWLKPRLPHTFFNGYYDDPEATAAAWAGDWLKTGDLLRADEDGNYFFVDRKKDAVRFKGRNISTFEVEHVARQHPAVSDCAAYGIPSAVLSSEDELKLDITVLDGADVSPEALARFINDNAPHYFVPRYIERVDSLPYTPTNKVQKYRLRERGVDARAWDRDAAGFVVER